MGSDCEAAGAVVVYFLYPRLARRPRARSNLRPLDLTRGLEWLFGLPGAPKILVASLCLWGPWISRVYLPVVALRANWSKVMISPPALRILSRVFSVTCRAHTVILGTSKILRSLE